VVAQDPRPGLSLAARDSTADLAREVIMSHAQRVTCFGTALLIAAAIVGLTGQTTLPRIGPADLVRVGTFKVPAGIRAGGSADAGFEYGGTALAFNPGARSLYVVGHAWDNFGAEISIPAPGGTATVLQPLTDLFEGRERAIGSGSWRVGGQLVYNGKLYTTAFLYYDGEATQTLSHFTRPLDLRARGGVVGPLRAGSLGAGFYSGYMTTVPADWRTALGGPALTGNCCLSVISRTSFGPSAFSFDPERPGSATPLVYYPQDRQTLGSYGAAGSHPVFNGTTRITGIVFPQGASTVLFLGSTGIGNYCYGEARECGQPGGSKGEHAHPYRAYAWAYDAGDLAAVKAGKKRPWDVRPYATWELPGIGDVAGDFGTGGAAYDPESRTIYLSVKFGDGERPLIHVFRISGLRG
jgi:hypothetical protein